MKEKQNKTNKKQEKKIKKCPLQGVSLLLLLDKVTPWKPMNSFSSSAKMSKCFLNSSFD